MAQARHVDAADDIEHPETPPHFARSGWTTAIARDAISASKAGADHVLAGGEQVSHAAADVPFLPGPVGAQRLLEPTGGKLGETPAHRDRRVEVPGLVGVDHHGGARARGAAAAARLSRSRAVPKPTFSLNAVWPTSRSAVTVSPGRSGLMPLA